MSNEVDAIVAQALKEAGVPSRNIPPVAEKATLPPVPRVDGKLKGATKGADNLVEPPEEQAHEETSPSEVAPPEPTDKEQLLSKKDIESILDMATRKFQSIVDSRTARLNSQVQATLNQFVQGQNEAYISTLPEEEQLKLRNQQLQDRVDKLEQTGLQPAAPIAQQSVPFIQYLANIVDAVGLRIDDKRIDWAPSETTMEAGMSKFISSVKKALGEDRKTEAEKLKNEHEQSIKKLRKTLGVDRVASSSPGGAGSPNLEKMTPVEKMEYAYRQNALNSQK